MSLNFFYLAAAHISNEEPTLSHLKDNHSVMGILDARLDSSAFGNIKDLSLNFPLSFKQRSNILTSKRPCRGFFRHLFKWKVNLMLSDLQTIDKRSLKLPNPKIFKRIIKDERKGLLSFSLSSKLGELANDRRSMLYIMKNIADNLAPEEGNLLQNWKDIGSCHGYKTSDLEAICKRHQSTESKTQRLLSLLCKKKPLPSLSRFIQNCRDIKRNDIARVLEGWLDKTRVSSIM